MDDRRSRYDQNNYYGDNVQGSRLAPVLDVILNALEFYKVHALMNVAGIKSGKVLDVGAGTGFFLHQLQKKGCVVFGTTASTNSAKSANQILSLHLEVTDSLDEVSLNAPFDAITYWHVYEHLENPQLHASKWLELVRPGGIVLIEVPNIESVGSKLCYQSWLGSDDRHHINHQAPDQIRETLIKAGFEVIRTEYFSLKFSYVFIWSSLLGFLFGNQYSFDAIMAFLKKPLQSAKERPVVGCNTLASLFYLAPVICILIAYGLLNKRGEIVRLFGKK